MKESKKTKKSSSLVCGILVLCPGCIGYVTLKNWIYLVGGLVGFTLINTKIIIRYNISP